MAKYTGQDLIVRFGTCGASAAITANLIKSVDISRSLETFESSGAGDVDKTFLSGKRDGTVKIDAWDDSVAATLRAILVVSETLKEMQIFPEGLTGRVVSFSGYVTAQDWGIAHNGVSPVSVTIQVTGPIGEG